MIGQRAALEGTTLQNRYRLDAQLGRGGMGVVYRAYDTLLHREVAVKVLSDTALGSDGRARLLREAQAAAKLNHPNIVSVYDAGEAEGVPFIVMELVEGRSLHDQPPQALSEILSIAQQVCAALEHAHNHDIVHRDLKPENVLIAADGTAKLMDFGLARSVSSHLTTEGTIVGTVFYLAPEQALGQKIDDRADLYALGVMLYELTAGRLPFTGDDPLAIISQHLNVAPISPRWYKPQIPEALDAIILKLLAKDSAERFPSARELQAALETVMPAPGSVPAAASVSLLDKIVRGKLIGREKELAELRGYYDAARAGTGRLVLIGGEPGIGKTRLVEELAVYARLLEGTVLTGRCYEQEGALAYLPFIEAFRQYLHTRSSDQLRTELVNARDIVKLLPEVQALVEPQPTRAVLTAEEERLQLFDSVARFMENIARETPLVLVLDDLHWADKATLQLLQHLARETRRARILIVGTFRDTELDTAHPLDEALVELNRERLVTRIPLRRLPRESTEALLAAMFQEEITPEFLQAVYGETEGNPFFIEEVCKSLIDEGKLYFEDGRWRRPGIEELEIPQSVKSAIGRRVKKLSDECQRVLTLASVIGREFDFDVLRELAQVDENRLLDLIDEALRSQLIRETRADGREVYVFQHALIAQTLYGALNLRRQARLHEQVGIALEKIYSRHLEEHVDELAYHFYLGARGGEIDRAVRYSVLAAERAEKLLAYDDAVQHYDHAISLLDEAGRTAETLELWEHVGDVHRTAGDRAELGAAYERAVKIWEGLPDPDKETGIRLYTKIGEMARWAARHPQMVQYVEKGLQLLGSEEPTLARARLLNALAHAKYWGLPISEADFVGAQRAAEEALQIAEQLDNPEELSAALDALTGIHVMQGSHPHAWEIIERRLKLFNRLNTFEQADVLSMAARTQAFLGEYARAIEYSKQALELARRGRRRGLEVQETGFLVWFYLEWDRWGDALRMIYEYLELFIQTGARSFRSPEIITALARLGAVLANLRGEPMRDSSIIEEAMRIASGREGVKSGFLSWAKYRLAELLIALARFDEAQTLLQEIDSQHFIYGIESYKRMQVDILRTEIVVAKGDPSAVELTAVVEGKIPQWDRRSLAWAKRAAGIALTRAGDFENAEKKLREALAFFEQLDTPWQQGRTLSALGELSRARGDPLQARDHFTRALALFDAMEARRDAEKTRGLLKNLD